MPDAPGATEAGDVYDPWMIDFQNASVFKLKEIDPGEIVSKVQPLLVDGEKILSAHKGARDYVVFTDKRLIAVNVQGLTGKKQDFTSLPFSKLQAWSVETAGSFDLDAELELWFSGLGKVRLEFKGAADIKAISQTIASFVL